MFGTYRTLLAVMVVALHLGGLPAIGNYAVFGFYLLSGYLMTFIMQENYGYSRSGLFKYALNRFLRIYPLYWVCIALSAAIIVYTGSGFSFAYHHSLYLPKNAIEVLKNLFIFFPVMESPRLTPPAWALTVEIFFYICIGLGLSKTKNRVVFWLAISVIYHLVALVAGTDRYFTIFAASLPFSTGAFIYYAKQNLLKKVSFQSEKIQDFLPLILFSGVLMNWLLGAVLRLSIDDSADDSVKTINIIFFYSNYLLCALMVVVLAQRKTLPFISRSFDKSLGDLSYPIYLIHYQVGLIMVVILNRMGIEIKHPDIRFMLLCLPFIFIVSWIISRTVEQPIERLRNRVKQAH
jgi:peptidoglycan/LPS O-acetylase OafA/YrhL